MPLLSVPDCDPPAHGILSFLPLNQVKTVDGVAHPTPEKLDEIRST